MPPARPSVLIVDYDHSVQYFIKILLQDLCLTWAAYSASMAYTLLEARPFDLVIIDVEQPRGIQGLTVLRAIRAMPCCEHLPAIGMIFDASEEQREELRAQGFNEVVSKLPDPIELRSVVERVLHLEEPPQEGA